MSSGKYFQDTYDRLQSILEEGKERNIERPIIVEGRRDRDVLRELGFEGEIILLNQGMNLVDFADEIATHYSEVILLLDWDRKGEELTEKLRHLLRDVGVHCDLRLWDKLHTLLSSHISSVEELSFFVQ